MNSTQHQKLHLPTRSQSTYKIQSKEIAKPITPPFRVQLLKKTKQSDWLADMDEEIDEHELEAHTLHWQRSRRFPNSQHLGTDVSHRTVDYDKLERKLNETLGLLAQKEIDIKEGLKVKAYEISVVKEKHDELVKQSLLTKSHYEGLVKEKTKKGQSIKTIHMLAPKCPTFNRRPSFANPMYLKKAQYEKPCLYAIPHDQSDPANRLIPDREEILTLEEESRSKLNKD
ncbi:hypothetical protein Tco_0527976 [Tanacetum coccineum]